MQNNQQDMRVEQRENSRPRQGAPSTELRQVIRSIQRWSSFDLGMDFGTRF